MVKGTTPTVLLHIPFSLEYIANAQFTMSQDVELIKYLKDMTQDEDYKTLSFQLTLDEMNAFTAHKAIEAELRIKLLNGEYIKSRRYKIPVEPSLKEGEF